MLLPNLPVCRWDFYFWQTEAARTIQAQYSSCNLQLDHNTNEFPIMLTAMMLDISNHGEKMCGLKLAQGVALFKAHYVVFVLLWFPWAW